MKTHWILKTEGNPRLAVQHFLYDLWPYADLEGMLVQLDPAGASIPAPTLVEDPMQLLVANPFLPMVTVNAGGLAARLASRKPPARIGAVLRSCEARAFFALARQHSFARDQWLVIGVDCLGSFPLEDYTWRLHRAGVVDRFTGNELRFARQGGISVDRYRQACQACTSIIVSEADVWIELLGLPIKQVILVTAANQALTERLHLAEITDEQANPELLAQRERVLARVSQRRMRSQQSSLQSLAPDLPADASSLMDYLEACMPCQECLNVCPFCDGDIPTTNADQIRWLSSCVSCGMCEEACPRHLPLTAIHTLIHHNLLGDILAV